MRARDELRTATLRMALTAVTNEEVSGHAGPRAERRRGARGPACARRRSAARRRRRSTAAGRTELADRERAELVVLEGYLPAAIGDDELAALVAAAVERGDGRRRGGAAGHGCGHEDRAAPGRRGRADGGRVAAEVRRQLGLADRVQGRSRCWPEVRRRGLAGRVDDVAGRLDGVTAVAAAAAAADVHGDGRPAADEARRGLGLVDATARGQRRRDAPWATAPG